MTECVSGKRLRRRSKQVVRMRQQCSISFMHGICTARPSGLPAGAIARGSVFSIYGSNIGPGTSSTVSAFPIGKTLAGVSITLTQGAATVDILPLYVSATQINALMPSNAPLGLSSMRLTFNNGRSNPAPVRVTGSAFGIYTLTGTGMGPAAVLNFVAADNQPFNSFTTPAKPGQVVTMYGTGLGPISTADSSAPPAVTLPVPVEVSVGGQNAGVLYSGRSSCCAGIDQIVFTVPTSAPLGCWVPVSVRTNGNTTSNVASMSISGDGAACADAGNPLSATLRNGGRAGVLRLVRSSTREDIGTLRPLEVADDLLTFDFAQVKSVPFAYSPLASLPPAGTCTVFAFSGDYFGGDSPASVSVIGRRLDAGTSFTVAGPSGSKVVAPFVAGARGALLGTFAPFVAGLPNQLSLAPGPYTVQTSGGTDVAAFPLPLTMPGAITWAGRDQLDSVNRTQPLTLSWRGVADGQSMSILGGNVDLPTNSSAVFHCLAPPGASSFTVPAAILQALPASRSNPLLSRGAVYLSTGHAGNGTLTAVPGLDTALAVGGQVAGKTVVFQ